MKKLIMNLTTINLFQIEEKKQLLKKKMNQFYLKKIGSI